MFTTASDLHSFHGKFTGCIEFLQNLNYITPIPSGKKSQKTQPVLSDMCILKANMPTKIHI